MKLARESLALEIQKNFFLNEPIQKRSESYE